MPSVVESVAECPSFLFRTDFLSALCKIVGKRTKGEKCDIVEVEDEFSGRIGLQDNTNTCEARPAKSEDTIFRFAF